MTKYNTGNPVGSTDPRDRHDNSQAFDEGMNSESPAFTDRLGVSRKSWKGMENEFGQDQANRIQRFNDFMLSSGYVGTGENGAVENYAAGIEITEYNQIIRDSAGELWRASGSTTLPYTTTGAGLPEGGAFVAVGDAVLRQELAASTTGQGSDLIDHTGTTDTVTEALDKRVLTVENIGRLRAVENPQDGQAAAMSIQRPGLWVFLGQDMSEQVALDPDLFDYIAPAFDLSGASGAWVKRISSSAGSASLQDIASSGPSLLNKLVANAYTRGMYIRQIDANNIGIGIGLNAFLKSVVEFRLRYDADNLLLLRGVFSGVEDESKNSVRASLSGTYNTNSPPDSYTTTVGDTWTADFTGQSFYFRRRVESRGGLWKLTVQPIGVSKTVSCYSPTTQSNAEVLVFDDLPYGNYRVEAEFLGDDPVNPASGGTPRGYLSYSASDPSVWAIRYGKVRPIDDATAKDVVSQDSIPDFAIRARPVGAEYATRWVPAHSGQTGLAVDPRIKVNVDGLAVIDISGNALRADYQDYREIKNVELIQRFKAQNSGGASGDMWVHYIRHCIDSTSPVMTFQNRVEVLQDVQVDQVYFGMLPSSLDAVDKLTFDDGTEVVALSTETFIPSFGWGVRSAMYTGELYPGNFHAAAAEITSLRECNALGTDRQEATPGRITFREDGVTKVYWNAGKNVVISAGTVLKGEHKIGAVSGGRFPSDGFRFI